MRGASAPREPFHAMTYPTQFQSYLVNVATEAQRYTPRHKALWRSLFKQAKNTIRRRRLTCEASDLVEHWTQCTPDSPSRFNTVALDDMGTEWESLAESLRVPESAMVSLDNLEEHGDTFVGQEEQHDAQDRLASLVEWVHGLHPVESGNDLPDHLAHEVDTFDPEAHLEPAFLGFEGLNYHPPM